MVTVVFEKDGNTWSVDHAEKEILKNLNFLNQIVSKLKNGAGIETENAEV